LGLVPGTYTVRAEQADAAGNVGTSGDVSFTVTPPPPPPPPGPPLASFKWFPSVPRTGERVSLVSTSTDSTSPITAYAWALASKGAFTVGKPILTTSFATPGDHVVRLQVTAADGLSSIATETVHVVRPPLLLMQPFPIVRIAGIVTSSGVRLSVLSVQAPVGARVTVTCRGRGCPTASESRIAASSSKKHRATVVVIVFRRFERSLRAGVVLQVRIFKRGRIGKYTRFIIRHHGLPEHAEAQAGLTALPPGAALPIRLSSAPPLPVAAAAPPPVRAPQRSRPATSPAAAPSQTQSAPSEPAAAEAPAATRAPAQPAAEAAPSAPPPAPSSSGNGPSKPSSGGGSFESSG